MNVSPYLLVLLFIVVFVILIVTSYHYTQEEKRIRELYEDNKIIRSFAPIEDMYQKALNEKCQIPFKIRMDPPGTIPDASSVLYNPNIGPDGRSHFGEIPYVGT